MVVTYKWTSIALTTGVIVIVVKYAFDLMAWHKSLVYHPVIRQSHNYQEYVEVSELEYNCGIRHVCPDNSFSVFLSTGRNNENRPRLCVSGRYVIDMNVNGGGRGLNAAIIESTHFSVVSVRNFDTYRYKLSKAISSWLDETFLNNDILIIFTADEASVNLETSVKNMLNRLGSGHIQNIQYRSQWYMITQRGSKGFTVYEKITFSKNNSWREMIEFQGCIPRKIPKYHTTTDESLRENKKREQFCAGKKDETYKGFCNEARFEIILPALLTNRSLIGTGVLSVPIYFYASNDFEIFVSGVDSLLHQPGIHVPLITILYEEHQSDVPGVSTVYGMAIKKVKFPKTFQEKIKQAKMISSELHPTRNYFIVIDEKIILSPDFFFYMAQTLYAMERDETIKSISAWSGNCYYHEGDVHLSYRVHGFPKYAALFPVRSTEENLFYGDVIVPDVPRLQSPEVCHLPSLRSDNWIERPQDLTKGRYFHKLVMLQQMSSVVDLQTVLDKCSPSVLENNNNVIYYEDKNETLMNLLNCLGVMKDSYGTYEGIVRLSVEGHIVLLISSESTFYKARPIASA